MQNAATEKEKRNAAPKQSRPQVFQAALFLLCSRVSKVYILADACACVITFSANPICGEHAAVGDELQPADFRQPDLLREWSRSRDE